MHVTSKGQVTIPQRIREQLGIRRGTRVEFELCGDEARLRVVPGSPPDRRAWVEAARGRATTTLRTDDLMRLTRGED